MNEISAKKILETLASKYLRKGVENRLHLKMRLYCVQLKRGMSISEYINIYMKLLADLTNLDVVNDDEDKALKLLSSLPNEGYETFVLTLINHKRPILKEEVRTVIFQLDQDKAPGLDGFPILFQVLENYQGGLLKPN